MVFCGSASTAKVNIRMIMYNESAGNNRETSLGIKGFLLCKTYSHISVIEFKCVHSIYNTLHIPRLQINGIHNRKAPFNVTRLVHFLILLVSKMGKETFDTEYKKYTTH